MKENEGYKAKFLQLEIQMNQQKKLLNQQTRSQSQENKELARHYTLDDQNKPLQLSSTQTIVDPEITIKPEQLGSNEKKLAHF